MTKTTLGVYFLLVLAVSTLAGALASNATAKEKLTCEAAAKAYPPFSSSKCRPAGVAADTRKAGGLYITVFDEDERALPGFCVRINGKIMGKTQVPAFSLDAGDKIIEVQHEDVGHACQEATLKAGEIAKVGFQFFALREEVTQLSTTVMERQYYGAIAVNNTYGDRTEVFVDPARKRQAEDVDDRVARGSGSLKISNLVPGKYEVQVRKESKPCAATCPAPASLFRTTVTLRKCQTVFVEASAERPKPRAISTPCEGPKKAKTAEKSAKPTKKAHATQAHRDFWHASWRD